MTVGHHHDDGGSAPTHGSVPLEASGRYRTASKLPFYVISEFLGTFGEVTE